MPNVEFVSYKTVSLVTLNVVILSSTQTICTSSSDRHVCWQSLISNYLVPIVSYNICILYIFFIDAFINSCNEKLNVYTPNQSAIIYIFIMSLSLFLIYSHMQQ